MHVFENNVCWYVIKTTYKYLFPGLSCTIYCEGEDYLHVTYVNQSCITSIYLSRTMEDKH